MVLKISDSMMGQHITTLSQPGKISLVMIICNHCPYVLFRMPAISQIVKDYKDIIHCVAVNSNASDKYTEDAPEFMPAFVKKYDLQCPYIYDDDQSIAKAYGAVCTPEFYVVNKESVIAYHGELDPSHTSNDLMPTGSSLRHALDLTMVDKPITWSPNPSFGCSVKWRTP